MNIIVLYDSIQEVKRQAFLISIKTSEDASSDRCKINSINTGDYAATSSSNMFNLARVARFGPTTRLVSRQVQTSSSTNRKLTDRVAIITGSTEGIGYAIAERLAEDGAKVVVSSRKEENVAKAVDQLSSKFPNQISGTICHVGKNEDQDKLIDFTLEKYGKIDMLVSNVAVNPHFGPLMELDESKWDKIFDINVKAPFMLTKKVVPHMLKNNRPVDNGAIVYISSMVGYFGMNSIGGYAISKTAMLGLCKNFSMELGPEGIRVNLVAPGVIKTKFSGVIVGDDSINEYYTSANHLKRLGESHEVAGLVRFLCSQESSYITGENIVVAGGHYCSL